MTLIEASTAELATWVQGVFDPQADITAYELAVLLPLFFHGMTREMYDSLGAMQRHIRLAS